MWETESNCWAKVHCKCLTYIATYLFFQCNPESLWHFYQIFPPWWTKWHIQIWHGHCSSADIVLKKKSLYSLCLLTKWTSINQSWHPLMWKPLLCGHPCNMAPLLCGHLLHAHLSCTDTSYVDTSEVETVMLTCLLCGHLSNVDTYYWHLVWTSLKWYLCDKCAAFFDQFFWWSFWSSSTLPRLVVLHCVVLHLVVCFVLHCLLLCCDVMLCVVICLLLVTLWLVC